jgi:transposase
VRQVKRLCRLFKDDGLSGLASRKRGRSSNRKLDAEVKEHVVALVRELYTDFGPKLAHEKLVELHGVHVGRQTVRKWLTEAGIWLTRAARAIRAHQPRHRRQCLGELVQIDGCDHEWFENRADRCTLLVYVDDATGRPMELRFVETESAFDYFASTVSYLGHHGKPVAFYQHRHHLRQHAAGQRACRADEQDAPGSSRQGDPPPGDQQQSRGACARWPPGTRPPVGRRRRADPLEGNLLPYSVLDGQPLVAPGEIVENKRLGAVLSLIRAGQDERDEATPSIDLRSSPVLKDCVIQ